MTTVPAVRSAAGCGRSVGELPLSLVRSKQRMIDHGEVFTPPWMVDAMLDLVKSETERIESRFLEPACGSGNFLEPVLERKLAVVQVRHGRKGSERRNFALLALMSLYGIELLADNVVECRDRLIDIFSDYLRVGSENVWVRAAQTVVRANIVHGDAIAMQTSARVSRPIVFTEWDYLGKGQFQRREFRLDMLTTRSQFDEDTLFGSPGERHTFKPEKSHPTSSVAEIADLAANHD